MKKRALLALALFNLFLVGVILTFTSLQLLKPFLAQKTKAGILIARPPHLPSKEPRPSTSASKLTLIAAGDTMLGRYVNIKMYQKNDFTYPFQKIIPFFKDADLVFTNLESPLTDPCPKTSTGMLFCADKKSLEGLLFSGIDVFNLANNHILNYGQKGLQYTIDTFQKNNLHSLYCHQNFGTSLCPLYFEIKDQTLAFLGYDLVTYPKKSQVILEDIKKTKPQVDLIIISLHWGAEYQKQPSPAQIKLAHQIIDTGADLIIGHHPHVVQPVETYQNKLILYSLGNLVFDQPWSQSTKTGLIAQITFEDQKITQTKYQKVYIEDYCQPHPIN